MYTDNSHPTVFIAFFECSVPHSSGGPRATPWMQNRTGLLAGCLSACAGLPGTTIFYELRGEVALHTLLGGFGPF